MLTFCVILHVVISVGLIAFVLMQDPKGGAAGGLFGGSGGSSSSVFGATGAANALTRITRYLAIAFGINCIALIIILRQPTGSVLDAGLPAAAVPPTSATVPAAPAPEAGATTSTTAPSTPADKK